MTYSPTANLPGPTQMMSDLTDDALLSELAQDNKLAFRELTARYIDKIVRLAYKVVRNRQDAEDVAQEVFVSVWNYRTQWKAGEATFSTWIYRVAVNRSIDFQRKRKVQNIELTDDLIESSDMHADDIVSNRETQEILLSSLKELPEKQMLALLYFYYEEMEIDQICQRLNATEDAIRSLLKRGKASMKEILANRFKGDTTQITMIAPYLVG